MNSNYASIVSTCESLLMMTTMVLLPIFIIYRASHTTSLTLRWTVLSLIAVNTVMVMLVGSIHETRLFVLGFIPIIPSLSNDEVHSFIGRCFKRVRPLGWCLLATGSAVVSFVFYQPSIGKSSIVYQLYMWPYLTLLLGVAFGAWRFAAERAHLTTLSSVSGFPGLVAEPST